MDYTAFLDSKRITARPAGMSLSPQSLSAVLFPFQRDIVAWALRLGRACLFEDCGLGKTLQQLEWARQIVAATGGRVLILAPLAVATQTAREGARFDIAVTVCRDDGPARCGGLAGGMTTMRCPRCQSKLVTDHHFTDCIANLQKRVERRDQELKGFHEIMADAFFKHCIEDTYMASPTSMAHVISVLERKLDAALLAVQTATEAQSIARADADDAKRVEAGWPSLKGPEGVQDGE